MTKKENKKQSTNSIGTSTIITPNVLSEFLSERYDRQIDPKYIRNQFRNDSLFGQWFDDGQKTYYRFKNGTEIIGRIIDRFDEIEKERSERSIRSAKRRSERQKRSMTVFNLDENGNVKTETVETKPETETETNNEKEKTDQ